MYSNIHNELVHKVWALLHQTADLISKYEEAEFKKKSNLTRQQYLILHAMIIIRTPVTITDVADRVERNINTVSTILDRMEKRGLVQRVRDMPDRRSVRLEVTQYGMEELVKTTEVGWQVIGNIFSTYLDGDMVVLAEAIGKLREKIYKEIYPKHSVPEIRTEDFHNRIHMLEK